MSCNIQSLILEYHNCYYVILVEYSVKIKYKLDIKNWIYATFLGGVFDLFQLLMCVDEFKKNINCSDKFY